MHCSHTIKESGSRKNFIRLTGRIPFFISDHSSSCTLHMRVGNETKSHHYVFYTCPCFPIVRYIAVRPLPGEEKIIFFVFNSNVHGITFSPEVSVTETSFR